MADKQVEGLHEVSAELSTVLNEIPKQWGSTIDRLLEVLKVQETDKDKQADKDSEKTKTSAKVNDIANLSAKYGLGPVYIGSVIESSSKGIISTLLALGVTLDKSISALKPAETKLVDYSSILGSIAESVKSITDNTKKPAAEKLNYSDILGKINDNIQKIVPDFNKPKESSSKFDISKIADDANKSLKNIDDNLKAIVGKYNAKEPKIKAQPSATKDKKGESSGKKSKSKDGDIDLGDTSEANKSIISAMDGISQIADNAGKLVKSLPKLMALKAFKGPVFASLKSFVVSLKKFYADKEVTQTVEASSVADDLEKLFDPFKEVIDVLNSVADLMSIKNLAKMQLAATFMISPMFPVIMFIKHVVKFYRGKAFGIKPDEMTALAATSAKNILEVVESFQSTVDIVKKAALSSWKMSLLILPALVALPIAELYIKAVVSFYNKNSEKTNTIVTAAQNVAVIMESLKATVKISAGAALLSIAAMPLYIAGAIGMLFMSLFLVTSKLAIAAAPKDTKAAEDALAAIENLKPLIVNAVKLAVITTLGIPLFLAGIVGMLLASGFIGISNLLIKAAPDDKKIEAAKQSINSLSGLSVALLKSAAAFTAGTMLFLTASLGVFFANIFVGRLVTFTEKIAGIKINKTAVDKIMQLRKFTANLLIVGLEFAVGIALFSIATVGALAATLFLLSLQLVANVAAKIKINKSVLINIWNLIPMTAMLLVEGLLMKAGMKVFLIGTFGALMGTVFLLSMELLSKVAAKIKLTASTLKNVLSLVPLSLSLLISAASMAFGMKYFLKAALAAVLAIPFLAAMLLITFVASKVAVNLMRAVSAAVGIGLFGLALGLAAFAMGKVLPSMIDAIKAALLSTVLFGLVIIVGILAGIAAYPILFGIAASLLLAVFAGCLFLSVFLLGKITPDKVGLATQGAMAAIELFRVFADNALVFAKSILGMLPAVISALLLVTFSVLMIIGVGGLFVMSKIIEKLDVPLLTSKLLELYTGIGQFGPEALKSIPYLLAATVAAILLSMFSVLMLVSAALLFVVDKILDKIDMSIDSETSLPSKMIRLFKGVTSFGNAAFNAIVPLLSATIAIVLLTVFSVLAFVSISLLSLVDKKLAKIEVETFMGNLKLLFEKFIPLGIIAALALVPIAIVMAASVLLAISGVLLLAGITALSKAAEINIDKGSNIDKFLTNLTSLFFKKITLLGVAALVAIVGMAPLLAASVMLATIGKSLKSAMENLAAIDPTKLEAAKKNMSIARELFTEAGKGAVQAGIALVKMAPFVGCCVELGKAAEGLKNALYVFGNINDEDLKKLKDDTIPKIKDIILDFKGVGLKKDEAEELENAFKPFAMIGDAVKGINEAMRIANDDAALSADNAGAAAEKIKNAIVAFGQAFNSGKKDLKDARKGFDEMNKLLEPVQEFSENMNGIFEAASQEPPDISKLVNFIDEFKASCEGLMSIKTNLDSLDLKNNIRNNLVNPFKDLNDIAKKKIDPYTKSIKGLNKELKELVKHKEKIQNIDTGNKSSVPSGQQFVADVKGGSVSSSSSGNTRLEAKLDTMISLLQNMIDNGFTPIKESVEELIPGEKSWAAQNA